MRGQTTIYRYNPEGQLISVKVVGRKDTQVRLWRRGNRINYTISKRGKVVYGMSLEIPEALRRLRAMRAVFYPFDKRTLLEIMAHLKKEKGHR